MPPRREFGATWWGRAWLDALERRAVHDPNRLPRGRTYARQGRTTELWISPGRVGALVAGSRDEPYEVLLTIRPLRDDEWDCVLDSIAARAAHAAALLEGELDPGVVADARAVEVELLPRSGELRTACSCPDWAEPCKHAAAVCYLVADELDRDPFALLLLRGLPRPEVIDAVRSRRAAAVEADTAEVASTRRHQAVATATEGILASEAWSRPLGELPTVPPPPAEGPGRPAPWPSDPPRGAPFSATGLQHLAADAAARAWALRAGTPGASSHLELDRDCDLARRAASTSEAHGREIAERAGLSYAELAARAAAFAAAGAAGVRAVTAPPWRPGWATMAEARERLLSLGFDGRRVTVRENRITVAGIEQYLLDTEGRWYRLEKTGGRWLLTAGPAGEIDDLGPPG